MFLANKIAHGVKRTNFELINKAQKKKNNLNKKY